MNSFEKKDIRWQQRFQNYEKAFKLLEQAIQSKTSSEIERAGLIQFFEVTFELSWKLLKDYQEEQGYQINSPKESIKQAFQSNLIDNGHLWIDALVDRNATVHTYEKNKALEIEKKIRFDYFPLFHKLYYDFKKLLIP